VTREVIFAPEALTDLFELYDYIAADAGAERARNYTDRIVAACRNLVTFPERGPPGTIYGRACGLPPIAAVSPSRFISPPRRSSSTAFSMAGAICRHCSMKGTMARDKHKL
jgi:plasmid stabilization system protein ParE